MTPHQFGEWETIEDATCYQEGLKERTCQVCGYLEEESIPMTPHQFGEWETIEESTCIKHGLAQRTCQVCGLVQEQQLPLGEHQFNEDGICIVCGALKEEVEGGGGGGGEGEDNKEISNLFFGGGIQVPGGSSSPKFRIFSDISTTVYLRSTSYSTYTGTSWINDLDSIEYNETFQGYGMTYLPSLAMANGNTDRYFLQIELMGRQYLMPYFPVIGEREDYDIQSSDVFTEGNVDRLYAMVCYDYFYQSDGSPEDALGREWIELEKRYRAFVEKHYLSVPATTASHLQKIIQKEGWSATDPDIINKVASYVQNSATYNLQFDNGLNYEEDIIVAFLEDYREGICQHFASSTVLLLRMMGIPARYTIGYMLSTKEGKWLTYADAGHAWAEAYIDGFGWVNIESTASGGGGGIIGPGGEGGGEGGGDIELPDPIPITVCSASAYKVYDGTPLTDGSLSILSGSLLPGHSIIPIDLTELNEVGKVSNRFKAKVLDEAGNDVSALYFLSYEYGWLEVVSKPITIQTGSASKEYDGTALTCSTYTQTGLAPSHTITMQFMSQRIERGRCDNAVSDIKIYDEMGRDVTHNYSIEIIYGTLRVT